MIVGVDASRANLAHRTGTEWYSVHITRHLLRRHPEIRWRLYLRTPLCADLADFVRPGVEVRVLPWRGPLWSQLRLSIELARHPPDVLFVPAHTIPLLHPRATVTTVHDVGFLRRPDLYDPRPIGPRWLQVAIRTLSLGRWSPTEAGYHRWSLRRALAAAEIITVSQFSAQELRAVTGLSPTRLTVIPHGFARTEPPDSSSSRATLERYGLVRPFFLYAGRLERKKGIDRLADGYAALVARSPNAPDLALVGQPGFGAEAPLAELARLGPRVHRLPWLPPPDLAALFQAARALVFPSVYEGFGLPILEAFDARTPVVIADQPALRETAGGAALVAAEGPHGLAAALERCDHDQALRQALVERGQERLATFSWAAAADATFAVLQRAARRVAS